MKKLVRTISTLLCTTLIAALGFTSCGSQKKALEEKQRQEEAARLKALEEEEERARAKSEAEAQERLIREAERRRLELERQKLVYGPPTTSFNPNIKE